MQCSEAAKWISFWQIDLRKYKRGYIGRVNEAGRDPAEVTLVAVTKRVPVDVIRAAARVGVRHIGENRVQEAREKFPKVEAGVVRHLIGHLQTNKARYIPGLFDWVHSLDRIELAQALGRKGRAGGADDRLPDSSERFR